MALATGRLQEFKDIGCEIVGASCDSKHSHHKYTKTPRTDGGIGACSFPLLADFTKVLLSVVQTTNLRFLLTANSDAGPRLSMPLSRI